MDEDDKRYAVSRHCWQWPAAAAAATEIENDEQNAFCIHYSEKIAPPRILPSSFSVIIVMLLHYNM